MLDSPKWQTMWMESQHSSKSFINMSLSSQKVKKLLEDLKRSCSSSSKAVQIEALKCWGTWIDNQNLDSWKINTVCYTAVRPLLTKKLQPLYKDGDICKLKLNLLWNLLQKVQHFIHLEGPQYILEVFLQFSLTWLSSTDEIDNEISILIFKLILALFKKDFEDLVDCDKKMFHPLQLDILGSKNVFHSFAEKILNLFAYWKKLKNKSTILKIWKCFLERCELSCDSIPIPIWHKTFKIMSQICSERNESIKDRLLFLHRCATTLKSVLCSSKLIDCGNLLTTPCEALLKKLMELCTIESEEIQDSELFFLSQEITQVLSEESVTVGGYNPCTFVLDLLEEFSMKSLFWGVWCGLVYCFKMRLSGVDKSKFNKVEMKFFRKLRSVAVNFDLDKDYLHENCSTEVERHIQVLNISCLCNCPFQNLEKRKYIKEFSPDRMEVNNIEKQLENTFSIFQKMFQGSFSTIFLYSKAIVPKTFEVIILNFDLVKNFLKTVNLVFPPPLLEGLFEFQFITFQPVKDFEREMKVHILTNNKKIKLISNERKQILAVGCSTPPRGKKNESRSRKDAEESEEEIVTTPKTRSKRRAEEEESKREMNELQKRKKRKSFEVLVQEIVRKNKIRKTEKNSNKKNLISCKRQKRKVKEEKVEEEKENEETNKRQLRIVSKDKNKVEKKNAKTNIPRSGRNSVDSKLEDYFKILTRKSGGEKKELITETPKKRKSFQREAVNYAEKNDFEKKETGFKQTSLKALMGSGLKTENTKEGKEKRNKSPEPEKLVVKGFLRDASELLKLSPFKEVFHDHDYTKIEPPSPEVLERMLLGNKTKNVVIGKENLSKSEEIFIKKDMELKEGPQKLKKLLQSKNKSEINVKDEKNKVFPKNENTKEEGELQNREENINSKAENKMKRENILDVTSDVNPQRVLRKRKDRIEEPKKAKKDIKTPEKPTKKRVTRQSIIESENKNQEEDKSENVLINEKKKNATKIKKGRKSLIKVDAEEHLSETPGEKESSMIEDDKLKLSKDEVAWKKSEKQSEDLIEVFKSGKQEEVEAKIEIKMPEKETKVVGTSYSLESPPKEEKPLVLEITSETNEQEVELKLSTGTDEFLIKEKSEFENKGLIVSEVFIDEKENVEKMKVEDKEKTEKDMELDGSEEYGEIKRENKRFLLMDSLRANKKIKLDVEGEIEPLLKVMEKENLEGEHEKNESEKEEKLVSALKGKSDSCSKILSGNISSRALRMIALVPESTRAEQVHRESLAKVEVLKSKKAPNVDKNSRASKMLALLSGSVVKDIEDFEEPEEIKLQEDTFEKKLGSTPNIKTPVSTLKSPNSIKKRRSIRFDDAKNETVLFEIDTPPSRILEEREKFRRIKLQEINPPFL